MYPPPTNSNLKYVLDPCVAGGKFLTMALTCNPSADVYAVTLPRRLGGHPLLVYRGESDTHVQMRFLDIPMFGPEYGLELGGPKADISLDRPCAGTRCDLVNAVTVGVRTEQGSIQA